MTNLTDKPLAIPLGDYLTPQQAAPLLDLEPRMVQRWCQRGKLGQKIGGRYLIHKDEIDKFKETKPSPGPKPQQ